MLTCARSPFNDNTFIIVNRHIYKPPFLIRFYMNKSLLICCFGHQIKKFVISPRCHYSIDRLGNGNVCLLPLTKSTNRKSAQMESLRSAKRASRHQKRMEIITPIANKSRRQKLTKMIAVPRFADVIKKKSHESKENLFFRLHLVV